MNGESEFAAYVVDQMQPIGLVCAKRMFGGYGIFLDGLMFALIADAALYLKVDAQSAVDFESRGLGRFRYQKKGKS